MRANNICGLAVVAVLLHAPVAAQQYGGTYDARWEHNGFQVSMELGAAIVKHADLDGDGISDIVVSAPLADTTWGVDCGEVYAISGATRTLLWTHQGRWPYEQRGFAMALAGDWNGDGLEDIAVGSPFYDAIPLVDNGLIKILDAVTGVDVFTIPGANSYDFFGAALDGGFDFDHDGYNDFIVGAPGGDYAGVDSGRTYLYSSATMGLVNTFDGLAPYDFSGFAVSGMGDVNGDGRDDFLIGAPNASPAGVALAGQVLLITNDLTILYAVHPGKAVDGHLGSAVSGGGDWTGDGIAEYAMSAPNVSPGGLTSAGVIRVMDGATSTELYSLRGRQAYANLGFGLTFLEDLNHDGVTDLGATGRNPGLEGFVQIHDGPTGNLLQRKDGTAPGDAYGCAIAVIGDLDGSGTVEVAVGARGEDATGLLDSGNMYMLGFDACLSSSSDVLSNSAGGIIEFAMNFPASEAGSPYALLGSATGMGPHYVAGIGIPLSNDPLFARFASGSAPSNFKDVYGVLNATGDGNAHATASAGSISSLVGNTFWFAAVSLTAAYAPRLASVAVPLAIVP
ncbi:MAG: FG-GAP repeat protein [Planctomycetes bacterium]|nr:FG-GAP repeat protein [Planctomycetota bacterium]